MAAGGLLDTLQHPKELNSENDVSLEARTGGDGSSTGARDNSATKLPPEACSGKLLAPGS